MAQSSRRLTIELEPGPPLRGTLAVDDVAGKRAFTGWISLLSALADAVEMQDTEQRTTPA